MRCPWCDFDAAPRQLHAHLADTHIDHVELEERKLAPYYKITCPVCGSSYEHAIKPRRREAGFVDDHRKEIALVGFDMLINHLMAEHTPPHGEEA